MALRVQALQVTDRDPNNSSGKLIEFYTGDFLRCKVGFGCHLE